MSALKKANDSFRKGDYVGAHDQYEAAIKEHGALIPGLESLCEITCHRLRSQVGEDQIIVYTCNFGGYESVKQPEHVDVSVRYILFTDDPDLETGIWEKVIISDELDDPRRMSRLPKILPHVHLPSHDISLYIDSSLTLKTSDVRVMIAECLEGKDIALYRHYKRECVYQEIQFVMNSSDRVVASKELCKKAISKYESVGYPHNNGLFENALIVRRNTNNISRVNQLWWDEYITGTERDQFVFMYALWNCGVWPNSIRRGRQFRINPYVDFRKHSYKSYDAIDVATSTTSTTSTTADQPYIFIAYAPPSYGMNLGKTYNDYMERLAPGESAVFIDHDASFVDDHWMDVIKGVFQEHAGEMALFTARTNRINNPYQRLNALENNHNILDHRSFSDGVREEFGFSTLDCKDLPSTSGVVVGLSKETWNKHKFTDGFLKVDNKIHISHRSAGDPVYLMQGLYVYHFYRADNDLSHALRDISSQVTSTTSTLPHVLRNFVYDQLCVDEVDRYMNLLGDDEYGVFVPARAVFCNKDWYSRLCVVLESRPSVGFALLNDNILDPDAPFGTDVIQHRNYASQLTPGSGLFEALNASRDSFSSLGAFLLSKRTWKQWSTGLPIDAATFITLAERAGMESGFVSHVYLLDARETRQRNRALSYLKQRLRVGILTQGFWPQQAGMEMMAHNLATQLSLAGDDVVLFAPKPKKEFEELKGNYIVRRYRDFNHMKRLFAQHHEVMPLDVLYVQGAYLPASTALELKETFGVPVVLRTHGEDIQIDIASNYGYRLDPQKAAVIEGNIRNVDHNVVIGPHVREDVREITSGPITLIHNGVDTSHFTPDASQYMRETLGIGKEAQILLTVGRNVQKKSLHLAIETLVHVRRTMPSAVLVHVGKDGNGRDLRRYADENGVGEAFYQLGEKSYFDMPAIYSDADVFVFPARTETFGNVTVEAMACGLPCVEFDYTVNRDKIESGTTGYIVEYGDVASLAQRVLDVLGSAERQNKMSVAARERAVSVFSWASQVKKYRDVFKNLTKVI